MPCFFNNAQEKDWCIVFLEKFCPWSHQTQYNTDRLVLLYLTIKMFTSKVQGNSVTITQVWCKQDF